MMALQNQLTSISMIAVHTREIKKSDRDRIWQRIAKAQQQKSEASEILNEKKGYIYVLLLNMRKQTQLASIPLDYRQVAAAN